MSVFTGIYIRHQPRSQDCLSTALAQAVGFSTLIGCTLNDESVRKILKTQLRYAISNGLQLQSTKDQLYCSSHENNYTLGQRNVRLALLGCSWAGKENKKYRTVPGQNPPGQNPPDKIPLDEIPLGQNPPGQNPPGQNPPGQNPPIIFYVQYPLPPYSKHFLSEPVLRSV